MAIRDFILLRANILFFLNGSTLEVYELNCVFAKSMIGSVLPLLYPIPPLSAFFCPFSPLNL